jgi:hypothetical protein
VPAGRQHDAHDVDSDRHDDGPGHHHDEHQRGGDGGHLEHHHNEYRVRQGPEVE